MKESDKEFVKHVTKSRESDKCHNCVGKQACVQLIDGNEVLDKLIKEVDYHYPDEINKSELYNVIASMREE